SRLGHPPWHRSNSSHRVDNGFDRASTRGYEAGPYCRAGHQASRIQRLQNSAAPGVHEVLNDFVAYSDLRRHRIRIDRLRAGDDIDFLRDFFFSGKCEFDTLARFQANLRGHIEVSVLMYGDAISPIRQPVESETAVCLSGCFSLRLLRWLIQPN